MFPQLNVSTSTTAIESVLIGKKSFGCEKKNTPTNITLLIVLPMNKYLTQRSNVDWKTYSTGMASDDRSSVESASSLCEEYPFPLDSSKELSRRFAVLQYSLDEFPQVDSYAKVGQIDYIKQLLQSSSDLLKVYPDLVNDLKGFLTLRVPKILSIVIDYLLPHFVGDNGTNLLLVSKTYRLLETIYFVVDLFAIETNIALTNEVLAKTYGLLKQDTFWKSLYPQQIIELILMKSKPKLGILCLFEGLFWTQRPDNNTYLHLFKLFFSNYESEPNERNLEAIDQHIVNICELLDRNISNDEKQQQPYIEGALALHDFELRRLHPATVIHHCDNRNSTIINANKNQNGATSKSRAASYKELRKERDRLKKLALPFSNRQTSGGNISSFEFELGKENAPNVFLRVSKSQNAFAENENEVNGNDDNIDEIKSQVPLANKDKPTTQDITFTSVKNAIGLPTAITAPSGGSRQRFRDVFRRFFRGFSLHKHR